MEERELIAGCIAGDERCWREFLKVYGSSIFGSITALLRKSSVQESEAAEDIFAGVIEKLLHDDCSALRRFSWKSKLTTYLISIARNKTYDHLRSSRRRPTVSIDAPMETGEEGMERTIASELDLDHEMEVTLTVDEALKDLPTQERLILQLYYVEGMKEREIGDLLKLSVDAVSARKSRALKKMRSLVRNHDS